LQLGSSHSANFGCFVISERAWVVIVRMRNHQPTLDYVKKRKADGKGKMEIIRCLKRFVAREIFGYLCGARRSLPSISKAT
jgi:hypothetical protein